MIFNDKKVGEKNYLRKDGRLYSLQGLDGRIIRIVAGRAKAGTGVLHINSVRLLIKIVMAWSCKKKSNAQREIIDLKIDLIITLH